MIPESSIKIGENIEEITFPSKTYRLDLDNGRINGYIDGIDSVKQSVYKILRSERYKFLIYSWNYGNELTGLIGKDVSYIKNDIQRVIKEALISDDRITNVKSFTFGEITEDNLGVRFKVISTEGEVECEVMVSV